MVPTLPTCRRACGGIVMALLHSTDIVQRSREPATRHMSSLHSTIPQTTPAGQTHAHTRILTPTPAPPRPRPPHPAHPHLPLSTSQACAWRMTNIALLRERSSLSTTEIPQATNHSQYRRTDSETVSELMDMHVPDRPCGRSFWQVGEIARVEPQKCLNCLMEFSNALLDSPIPCQCSPSFGSLLR